ncbi:alpha/beta hydrolase [Erwinia sp. 198]|uniref:alpha/beta hydrolase n=1 Tax=Erwinia sp. 198 TaxID=2022746 RepID=UPI000F66983F|nr:alpha/beta hydrolase [Erwinia sp. 198]RRZ91657.1 alpha/beta hydrolase [Erwinia sp. 198]
MAAKQATTGKEMSGTITRVLNDEQSKAFFDRFPAMDIKIPFLTVRETLHYKPTENARQVSCSTRVAVAENDRVNPPPQALRCLIPWRRQRKTAYRSGAKRYDLCSGLRFDNVIV